MAKTTTTVLLSMFAPHLMVFVVSHILLQGETAQSPKQPSTPRKGPNARLEVIHVQRLPRMLQLHLDLKK
jgi:hypothetical protein